MFPFRTRRFITAASIAGLAVAGGITVAIAGLAAHGLDAFLARDRSAPKWMVPAFVTLALGWAGIELFRWRTGHFSAGWSYEVFVSLAIFAAGAWAYRTSPILVGAVLILSAAADYKTFGTSKRFNASAFQYKPFTSTGLSSRRPSSRTASMIFACPG